MLARLATIGRSGRGRSLAIGADERRELERDAGSCPTNPRLVTARGTEPVSSS